jgi:hypothetical protein
VLAVHGLHFPLNPINTDQGGYEKLRKPTAAAAAERQSQASSPLCTDTSSSDAVDVINHQHDTTVSPGALQGLLIPAGLTIMHCTTSAVPRQLSAGGSRLLGRLLLTGGREMRLGGADLSVMEGAA